MVAAVGGGVGGRGGGRGYDSTEPGALPSFENNKDPIIFYFVIFKLLLSLNAFILFLEEGENVAIYIHNM